MASDPLDLTNRLSHLPSPWADANFFHWEAGRSMASHRHGFLQVIHVLNGNLEVDWGAGWVAIEAGFAHILPPGHEHALRSSGGQSQFGLNAAATDDGRGVLAALLAAVREPLVVDARDCPVDAVRAAALAWPQHRRAHLSLAVDAYAVALLAQVAPAPEPLAQRLYMHLQARTQHPISVEGVARELGISRASLQRCAHHAFGDGVAAVHERLRIAVAANHVLAGLDVAGIAERMGYSDPTAFTRAFRRIHGCAPTQWRTQQRARMG